MPDMKLNAEVPLRLEGNDELHSIGTLKCPSTLGSVRSLRSDTNQASVSRYPSTHKNVSD